MYSYITQFNAEEAVDKYISQKVWKLKNPNHLKYEKYQQQDINEYFNHKMELFIKACPEQTQARVKILFSEKLKAITNENAIRNENALRPIKKLYRIRTENRKSIKKMLSGSTSC